MICIDRQVALYYGVVYVQVNVFVFVLHSLHETGTIGSVNAP